MDWMQVLTIMVTTVGSAYAFFMIVKEDIRVIRDDIRVVREDMEKRETLHRESMERIASLHREDIMRMDEKIVRMDEKWERLFERLLIQDRKQGIA